MENLLYRIWKYWALLVFAVVGLVFLPPMALILIFKHRIAQNIAILLFRTGALLALLLIGIIPIFSGNFKAIKTQSPLVFVANHRSYLDILICLILAPNNSRFLSKIEVFHWPIVGYFTKRLGHIGVDRSSARGRAESLEQISINLKEGKSLILFPEGKILKNTKLLNTFKKGAFLAATRTQSSIVCVAIMNAGIINPCYTLPKIRPGILRVRFSEPILTKGKGEEATKDLQESAYQWIKSKLKNYHSSGEYPIK